MSEQQPIAPATTDVVDVVDANRADPSTVREVFRARHRLAVSVMERSQRYTITHSLGDLHRMTLLSHDERGAIRQDWHAWHRKYSRLGAFGICVWLAGTFTVMALWFRMGAISAAIQQTLGLTVPDIWLTGVTVVVTLGLLAALPALLASVSAPALSDSYLRGYADGLTRGVHRALHITPEIEQEMWEELRRAEHLDASWRRVTDASAQK